MANATIQQATTNRLKISHISEIMSGLKFAYLLGQLKSETHIFASGTQRAIGKMR